MKKLKIAAVLVLSGIMISFVAKDDNLFGISKNLEIFAQLYREINTYYVDEVDPSKFVRKGIDAMLADLDPYTNFYSESEVEDYRIENNSQSGGLGFSVFSDSTNLIVSEIMADTEAQKSGLIEGDRFISIDGQTVKGKTVANLMDLLKGQAGTTVNVVVERPEKGVQNLKLVREKIEKSSVPYFGMLNETVGYIYLDGFMADSYKEVSKAYQDLKSKGMTKLVFDLRGNPGGLLDQAVAISSMFIPQGSLVVETKGKAESWNSSYKTQYSPTDLNIPVAVLINDHSASASEIVSGVMQDYDRGVIIGQKSYGKGLVQVVRPLVYNTQVKVTTAKYYTPSGRCIQALDYASKKVDGKAIKFDKRQAFKTSNGRVVYDADGVSPDIAIEKPEQSLIAQTLLRKHLIFDYATLYRQKHDSIVAPEQFKVTDAEYDLFVKFLGNKDYSYLTQTEKELENYTKTSEKEGYNEVIKAEIAQINSKLLNAKKADIIKYQSQIKLLLEEEIVKRYYHQDGKIRSKFDEDPEIQKAIEVLQHPMEYNKTLGK